jgi:hypothetical protein
MASETALPEDDNFQRRATDEGQATQEIAERVVAGAGFHELRRNHRLRHLGVTVNLVADDDAGHPWYFEISGGFTSTRPGLMRADTMWKTLGRASVLHHGGIDRFVILTTNLPRPGSAGDLAIRSASTTFFDAVEMLTIDGRERLRRYATGERTIPLPGPSRLEDLYPSLRTTASVIGEQVAVPLAELGERLPVRPSEFDVVRLPHFLRVIVPSKTAAGEPIPARRRTAAGKRIVTALSAFAGGCTGMEALGSWVDPIGGVMHEAVTAVEAFAATPFPEDVVGAVVRVLVDDLEQHTAALVVDDCMLHITPS